MRVGVINVYERPTGQYVGMCSESGRYVSAARARALAAESGSRLIYRLRVRCKTELPA